MTNEELLDFGGKLSELPEQEKKEAIRFFKNIIACYDKEDKEVIYDVSTDGVDHRFVDFLLANSSRKVYQNKKSKYENTVKQYIKTREK